MSNYRKVFASLIVGVGTIAGVSSAQADPAEGYCNDLDPSSGEFSTCIQAHSAFNRVDHLIEVGANEKAIARAQLSLEDAIAAYAALTEGDSVPGLPSADPILAVAYINTNVTEGEEGFGPGDTLIAKLIDTNPDGVPGVGDTIVTNEYPTDLGATSHDAFTTFEHTVTGIWFSTRPLKRVAVVTATGKFMFAAYTRAPNCWYEEYLEQSIATGIYTRFIDVSDAVDDGNDVLCSETFATTTDVVRARQGSPSDPANLYDDGPGSNDTKDDDAHFIDVDLF